VKKPLFNFKFFDLNQKPQILCLGAHPDDIEIGCGSTILRIIKEVPKAEFHWVVFSGNDQRQKEAVESATAFLDDVKEKKIIIKNFRDSYFPFIGDKIKDYFENLKQELNPDAVFTHYRNDAHQDHKLIANLTWNTFRDNLIFEYEIPKFDGDLSSPNTYVQVDESEVTKKIRIITNSFKSQSTKSWFNEETFKSILTIRGVESNSRTKYAEGFYCHKIVI
jgi:LmbE family N-acetylglucosaminyl deacetylase